MPVFAFAFFGCESEEDEEKEGTCYCEPESDEVVSTDNEDWQCPCWDRCPAGQALNGGKCQGQKMEATFSEATDPDACPRDVDHWMSQIPFMHDYAAILENCENDGSRQRKPVKCTPCAQSKICREMFGSDMGTYWCQDWDENPYSINLETGEFRAETDGGVQIGGPRLNYRCARYSIWR